MRFNKEARTLIYEASPNPTMITWPTGAPQPEPGKLYWLQNEEDAKKARERREYSPPTCADVMADMHNRLNPGEKKRKPKRRRRASGRPTIGDPRIKVLDVEIQEKGKGWKATVTLYEDPDPINHLRVKGKVHGGESRFEDAYDDPTELEPEQILGKASRQRRLEEEEAMKLEHRASMDYSEAMKAEQRLLNQRRKGKRSKLLEEAAERAKRRADNSAAESAV